MKQVETNQISQFIALSIISIALALLFFRETDLFFNPRFWAEEGLVYFHDAYINGIASLLHAHQGYFSLTPNLATHLATLVDLRMAPHLTLAIALIVQLIPFVLIAYSKSEFLDSPYKKIIASLIIMFAGNTEEVWLNTINSQFHFVVIAFIILIEDKTNPSRIKKTALILLTSLSGLSGIPANILTPFFGLRFYLLKQKYDLIIFLILASTTLVQIYFILTSEHHAGRIFEPNLDQLLILMRVVIGSLVDHPFPFNLYTGILAASPLVFFLISHHKTTWKENIFFFAPAVTLSVIMVYTSLGMLGGGRYFYPVAVIFMLGLMSLAFNASINVYFRAYFFIYLISGIALGIRDFPFREGATTSKSWPTWSDEVKRFEKGETTTLSISPQWDGARWTVTLPKK